MGGDIEVPDKGHFAGLEVEAPEVVEAVVAGLLVSVLGAVAAENVVDPGVFVGNGGMPGAGAEALGGIGDGEEAGRIRVIAEEIILPAVPAVAAEGIEAGIGGEEGRMHVVAVAAVGGVEGIEAEGAGMHAGDAAVAGVVEEEGIGDGVVSD